MVKNFGNLSSRQQAILKLMDDCRKKGNLPPSHREIIKETTITSTSVVDYNLDRLVDYGWIERTKGIARGIKLLKQIPQQNQVPFLGKIVAGQPIQIPDDIGHTYDTLVEVPPILEGKNLNNVFALEVVGDSMIEAKINEGDIVFIDSQASIRNGDIVAAWLVNESETTLKYFYKEGKKVRLQPANSEMQPIYVDTDNCQIQGKVIETQRVFKVFVSYSRTTSQQADILIKQIQAMGHQVWIDRHLEGGQLWWNEILKRIRTSHIFIAGLSPAYISSEYCTEEWVYAHQLKRYIIPVVLNNVDNVVVPQILDEIHRITLKADNPQKLEDSFADAPAIFPLPKNLPPPPKCPVSPIDSIGRQIRQSDLDESAQLDILVQLLRRQNDANSEKAKNLLKELRDITKFKSIADMIDLTLLK